MMVSIIIATYNSGRTLDACLSSIRNQDYPRRYIEIVIIDGGSTDGTKTIAKQYDVTWIEKKGSGAEEAKAIGLKHAKGDIIADFGSDNIISDRQFISRIVAPLIENPNIVGSYPLRYTYRPNDTIFNRYVALFGVNDPVPFSVRKSDRQSMLFDGYCLSGRAIKRTGYWDVVFTPDNLPTVGANGFFIRKDILLKANVSPRSYFHIDVVYDVVKKGYDRFAVVDTSIVHDTADTLFSLMSKRRRYLKELYLEKQLLRRYHIVRWNKVGDVGMLGLFVMYSVTIVQPLWLSIRGWLKIRDMAWFVHPVLCFLTTLVYAEQVIRYSSNKLWRRVLKH